MNISSILNLREGLYLYTELVDQVGLQHGLSATGHWGLWDRVAEAINHRKLRSRDPASSLPVGPTDAVTPVVTLEDFNEWLRGMGSGHLVVTREPGKQSMAGMGNSDVATSVEALPTETAKRLTPIERQDERLRIFRERRGQEPDDVGGRWRGVTAVASELGIARQTLTADLNAAYRREKRRDQAVFAFGSPSKRS